MWNKESKLPNDGVKAAYLFPLVPRQREKTIASAPSLIVLVLNPFPSALFFTYLNIVINMGQCQEQMSKLYIKTIFEKAYIDQLY